MRVILKHTATLWGDIKMIKIKRVMALGYGYQLTFEVDGITVSGKTYFDTDGHDKIDFDGKTYELVGLSYLREV
jgi:hypothetical protein